MIKRKPSRNTSQILFFLLYSILGTSIVWFFKYHNQGLGLSDFQFAYPGNLLQFFLWIFSVIGVLVVSNMRHAGAGISVQVYKSLALAGVITLILGKIFMYINFPSGMYLLDQPIKRIIVGLCYVGYQGVVIFTFTAAWTTIYNVKQMYFLRIFVNTAFVVIALIVFAFIYTAPWFGNVTYNKDNPYKFGVVFGAAVWSNNKPSPILVSRLDEAMNLYRAGIIKEIFLTGSNAPGEISEAEAAYNYLKKYDIPLNDIQLEKQTTSTTEQVRFLKQDLLKREGADRVLVISDKNHVRRIREITKFYNINVDVVGAELNLSYGKNLPYRLRESAALLIFWLFGL